MSKNMKGLLKGLRYISQIFEEEEEQQDIQIGFPTDVKHVAHIGWDGPSVTSPSWMDEFKSAPGNASSNGDTTTNRSVEEADWGSQDSTAKKSVKDSPGRDLPSLPKSRRQPSVESIGSPDSPVGSPTQKAKSSRRRSKQQKESSNSPRGGESSSQSLPNIPKKSRRKKSKDEDGSVRSSSSKSKEKSSRHGSRHKSDDASITKFSDDGAPSLALSSLKEDEVKE